MDAATEAVIQMLNFPDSSQKEIQSKLQISRLHRAMESTRIFAEIPSNSISMQLEHECFLIGFTKHVTAVVTQLNKLDVAAETGSQSVGAFWDIWELLHGVCSGMMKWTKLINVSKWAHLPIQPALSTALFNLMVWVLSASQNNSYAWVMLKSRQTEQRLVGQISLLLSIPCNSILYAQSVAAGSLDATAELCALPRDHLSLLCYLMYDLLGETQPAVACNRPADTHISIKPGRVRNRTLIEYLVTELAWAISEQHQDTKHALLNVLSTPAVIELMQLVVVLQGEERHCQSKPAANHHLLIALAQLMSNSSQLKAVTQSSNSTDISSCGSGSDLKAACSGGGAFHSATVPHAGSPNFAPISTVSGRRLLLVLCNYSPLDLSLAVSNLMMMHAVLRFWNGEMKLKNSNQFCTSLLTIAHHCSLHTLLHIKSFQSEEHQQQMVSLTQQQQQQRQILLGAPIKTLFDQQVYALVQSIMVLVSDISLRALSEQGAYFFGGVFVLGQVMQELCSRRGMQNTMPQRPLHDDEFTQCSLMHCE